MYYLIVFARKLKIVIKKKKKKEKKRKENAFKIHIETKNINNNQESKFAIKKKKILKKEMIDQNVFLSLMSQYNFEYLLKRLLTLKINSYHKYK